MTACLLDANVPIALVDQHHGFNRAADRWFSAHRHDGWATCPLTENAVVRNIGNPRDPESPGGPAVIMLLLRDLIGQPGHRLWPDDVGLLDRARVDGNRLLGGGQVTDTCLLALAVANRGRLGTFDHRLSADAVTGGAAALHLIPTGA